MMLACMLLDLDILNNTAHVSDMNRILPCVYDASRHVKLDLNILNCTAHASKLRRKNCLGCMMLAGMLLDLNFDLDLNPFIHGVSTLVVLHGGGSN